jgi:hypothetical protein
MKPQIKEKMPDHSSAIYGLAFIGAVVYFIQHATSFWLGVLGVLKAIVWPAILMYKLFEFLEL